MQRLCEMFPAVLLIACSLSPSTFERVRAGAWGGEHVSLSVTEAGGSVEFDCAHGSLDAPLVLDQDGRFAVAGQFMRERGGPIRRDEPETSLPARYHGTVRGEAMSLEVSVGEDAPLGPFGLVFERPAHLFKCR